MTREQITNTTTYYRMFRAGSWVSVPRDGLLDALAALEAAWKEIESLENMNHLLEKSIDNLVGDLTKERDQLKHYVRRLEAEAILRPHRH